MLDVTKRDDQAILVNAGGTWDLYTKEQFKDGLDTLLLESTDVDAYHQWYSAFYQEEMI